MAGTNSSTKKAIAFLAFAASVIVVVFLFVWMPKGEEEADNRRTNSSSSPSKFVHLTCCQVLLLSVSTSPVSPIIPLWNPWQESGQCSATCGTGTRHLVRSCSEGGGNVLMCGTKERAVKEEECTMGPCEKYLSLSSFSLRSLSLIKSFIFQAVPMYGSDGWKSALALRHAEATEPRPFQGNAKQEPVRKKKGKATSGWSGVGPKRKTVSKVIPVEHS